MTGYSAAATISRVDPNSIRSELAKCPDREPNRSSRTVELALTAPCSGVPGSALRIIYAGISRIALPGHKQIISVRANAWPRGGPYIIDFPTRSPTPPANTVGKPRRVDPAIIAAPLKCEEGVSLIEGRLPPTGPSEMVVLGSLDPICQKKCKKIVFVRSIG
jgi:hypothetical protein